MLDKHWEYTKMILTAFIVGFVLSTKYRWIGLIVLVGIVIWKHELDVKVAGGVTVKFIKAFISATAFALGAHVLLGIVFGTGINVIHDAPGALPALLTNPAAITGAVANEVAALVATIAIWLLWYYSEKPRLWLYRLALVAAVFYLGFQAFNDYASLPKSDSDRQRAEIRLANHARSKEQVSLVARVRHFLNKDADRRYVTDLLPDMAKATRPGILCVEVDPKTIELVKDDDGEYKTGKIAKSGELEVDSEWIIHYAEMLENIDQSGLTFSKLVRRDKDEVRWVRQDYLKDLLANQPVTNPTPPVNTATIAPAPVVAFQPKPEEVAKQPLDFNLTEETVRLEPGDWTPIHIVVRRFDQIRIYAEDGGNMAASDLHRISMRSGRLAESTIGFNPPLDKDLDYRNAENQDKDVYGLSICDKHVTGPYDPQALQFKLVGDEPLTIHVFKKISNRHAARS